MEPTTSSQAIHFDVEVFSPVHVEQRLQTFVGGLIVFAVPTLIVIAQSTTPPWLIAIVMIMVLAGITAFYNVVKPRMFAHYGYKLVRRELRMPHHRLHIMSIEDNGRFVAVLEEPSIHKVYGVMTLIESDGGGLYMKYRIDLLPE